MGKKPVVRNARALCAVGAIVAGAVLAFGAVAFACSGQATLRLSSVKGSAGEAISGTGGDFARGVLGKGTEVQIRWNSTTDGVLWSGVPDVNGDISFSFAVPASAAVGHYSIVATQGELLGRTAFEVVPPAMTTGGSTNPGGSTTTGGSTNPGGSTTTGGSTNPAGPNEGESNAGAGAATDTGTTGSAPADARSEGASAPAAPAATAERSPAAAVGRGAAPSPSPAAPRAGAQAATSPAAPGPVAAAPAPPEAGAAPAALGDDAVPSPATVADDVWSGFGSGATPSLFAAGASTTPGSPGGPLAAGMALVVAGLLGIAGVAAVSFRRRRAVAVTE